jgi:hypothetical protein
MILVLVSGARIAVSRSRLAVPPAIAGLPACARR